MPDNSIMRVDSSDLQRFLSAQQVAIVNDNRDNDTVAAIVGAAVGALHGKNSLPQRLLENQTGRTSDSDDGMI